MIIQTVAELRVARAAKDEAGKLKVLLTGLGLTGLVGEIIERTWEISGDKYLSFTAFRSIVPDLPIMLGYDARLFATERDASCALTAMLKQPEKSRFFAAWQDFRDALPSAVQAVGIPVGLVFPYGHVTGGLVIHDGHFSTRATRVQRRSFSFQAAERTLTIERFGALGGGDQGLRLGVWAAQRAGAARGCRRPICYGGSKGCRRSWCSCTCSTSSTATWRSDRIGRRNSSSSSGWTANGSCTLPTKRSRTHWDWRLTRFAGLCEASGPKGSSSRFGADDAICTE